MSKIIRIILTLLGAILISQCLFLILLGKINFGTVVPLGIGIVFVVHGILWRRIRKIITNHRWLKTIWLGLWVGFALWLASFVVFVISLKLQIEQNKGNVPEVAAIIVLGSGTVAGQPTPTLAKRLDAAVPIINSQRQATAITSGGVGMGRSRSEADIMATYLYTAHHIPLSRIVQEGQSSSTEENLANSKALLAKMGMAVGAPDNPVAIVTSDFHTIRAAAIARRQDYAKPITIASTTPLSIRYNAWFREYFAFVSGWLLDEY